MWDLWWIEVHWNKFSPNTSIIPCQYRSTKAPYSSASSVCSYQKDKGVMPGNYPPKNELPELGKRWIEKYFHLVFKVKADIHRALREKPKLHLMNKLDLFKPHS